MPSDQLTNIRLHTIQIAEEIERTRQICAHSLELLRLPIPSTFLGRKLEPPREMEE